MVWHILQNKKFVYVTAFVWKTIQMWWQMNPVIELCDKLCYCLSQLPGKHILMVYCVLIMSYWDSSYSLIISAAFAGSNLLTLAKLNKWSTPATPASGRRLALYSSLAHQEVIAEMAPADGYSHCQHPYHYFLPEINPLLIKQIKYEFLY